MTDFADLAAQALKHDPASCTREPCGRCRPSGAPNPPAPVNHDVRPTSAHRILAVDQLHQHLTATTKDLARMGDKTWRTFADWTRSPHQARDILRGGGLSSADGDGRNDEQLENARLDRQAAAYHDELATLTRRIDSDLTRLQALMVIAHRDNPKAAPDQGCRSCARLGEYEPIHTGRYAHFCRFCGEYKAAEGEMPPIALLRWRKKNPGRRGIPSHVLASTRKTG